MHRQMDIFDFVEKPPDDEQKPLRTQFEQLFEKVKNPVMLCANCLCQYCANNEEEVWHKVKPEEIQEPCLNCDKCKIYGGDCQFQSQRKEYCTDFVISDYAVEKNRKRINLVKK